MQRIENLIQTGSKFKMQHRLLLECGPFALKEPVMERENIFLFVPNIIGFARVFLALVAFYFMPTHCIFACTCYVVSALLDAFDGRAARAYNQSTKFGAMLDQLTDRAGTAGLMMTLATFYPKYTFWFQISMVIDVTCHWIYLHSVTLQGRKTHKFIDVSGNPIMRLYYNNMLVLFFMCFGNEAFYASLYVMNFYTGPIVYGGLPLFKLLALLNMPIAVLKAAISVVQGIVAALNIATIDVNERAALAALPKRKDK